MEIPEQTNKLLKNIINENKISAIDTNVYECCKLCGTKKLVCNVCGVKYTITNKWHHNHTKTHITYDKLNKRLRELATQSD